MLLPVAPAHSFPSCCLLCPPISLSQPGSKTQRQLEEGRMPGRFSRATDRHVTIKMGWACATQSTGRGQEKQSSRGKERGAMPSKGSIRCSGGKMSREINTQIGRISPPPKKEKLWLMIHVCQCINKLGLYVHVCSITCMMEHTCTLSDVHMHSYRNICIMDSHYKLNMDACTDVQLYVCECMNKSFCLAGRRT